MVRKFKQKIGTRAQVMHGTAKITGGGLTKRQLKYNKRGKIVSKKASKLAKKNNRLVKAGFLTRKGHFGVVKRGGATRFQYIKNSIIKKPIIYNISEKNNLYSKQNIYVSYLNKPNMPSAESHVTGTSLLTPRIKNILNTNKVINYSGKLFNPQLNEYEYMEESLGIPEDVVPTKIYEDNLVYIFKNIVIKVLKVLKVLNSNSNSNFCIKTCELTKQAYLEDIGVNYIGHVIVKHRKIPKRVYLFTQYLQQIENTFDIKKIEEFAIKISNTSLLFHPDFWYKNICKTKSGELKAIDWDGRAYEDYKGEYTKSNSVQKMMAYYHKHLKRT